MTIPTLWREEPAFSIVEKLGGKTAVAEELGLDKSTISRWCQPRPAGTGGLIPQRHWSSLMALAVRHGTVISLQELSSIEG